LLELPALKSLSESLAALREPDEKENLSPALAEKLYGPVLKSSVSRLEEFAQCPFKFFVRSGLHANERKVFELDARERGNFQHDVLKMFHEQLQSEGKRWRDLEPLAARERIGQIAAQQMEHFRDGLFRDSAETVFAARSLAAALQDFVEVIVGWMRGQYEFDPASAEIGFGGKDDAAPAWEVDLGGGRKLALQGRIDRVDLWRGPDSDAALAVVTDYKSGGKKLDSLLVKNGVQLQLLAYLGALRHWKNPQEFFGAEKIVPAGAFYVNLRGEFKSGGSRAEVLGDDEAKQLAYRHNGRFDAGWLKKFDRRADVKKGDQFNFRLNKDGSLPSNSAEAISGKEFTRLLDQVEEQLRALGEQIFSGAAAVDPYRKGTQTACEYCDYRAACRIDPWTHQWRVLRAAEMVDET
ncbi:MAG TPA: PD-(D/E)XK nuclease family protein, partial [Candidatus Limnocylindrales bacterium]|nr:PD-(D/E)XK nuclease family protein [Candidatus Limnocylindrales bacterium]